MTAFQFLHRLTSTRRTRRANRQLGAVLAFVAGAVNAGGFLAVQRYTSHMTGIVSAIADDLAVGSFALALAGLVSLAASSPGRPPRRCSSTGRIAAICPASTRWHCCWKRCCCCCSGWWAPT
jgi:hypothetical protein